MSVEEGDLKLLLKALQFSALKHRNQRRKDVDASPYINHPISLASILCNEAHITDIEVICGALLHDTVEDTETMPEELEREFGPTIKNIVMDVTDDTSLKRHERKQAQIDHAAHISDKAKLVKLADKISNLRDVSTNPPPDWSLQRRQEYFDWARKVIDQVRGVNPLLESIFDEICSDRPCY
ncbi:MAG: HD domain-containing protein [Gammaproteobacteria bacterium]|jgi:guanosine-3',5'-bis(diphosphate) 3'-pyrophosphohydrolase|nr:HD domain-containing protein [Gammaproteobacteria bacterium]